MWNTRAVHASFNAEKSMKKLLCSVFFACVHTSRAACNPIQTSVWTHPSWPAHGHRNYMKHPYWPAHGHRNYMETPILARAWAPKLHETPILASAWAQKLHGNTHTGPRKGTETTWNTHTGQRMGTETTWNTHTSVTDEKWTHVHVAFMTGKDLKNTNLQHLPGVRGHCIGLLYTSHIQWLVLYTVL
jgi:hypothetical protein